MLNKSFSVYFKLYITERVGLVWGQKNYFNMGKSIKSRRIIAVRKQRKARNFQDFKNRIYQYFFKNIIKYMDFLFGA